MGRCKRYRLPTLFGKGGPFEISIFIRSTMPYCRECGKEVQEDWISCPYCSKPIGPPASNSIGLKDSVVMGDVSIADASVECARCKSTGVTITACMVCKNPAFCSVCDGNVDKKRDTVCGEHHYDGNVDFHEGNVCDNCFDSIREKSCDGSCSHCGICIVLAGSEYNKCHFCVELEEEIESSNHEMLDWQELANTARERSDHREASSREKTANDYRKRRDKASQKLKARKKS